MREGEGEVELEVDLVETEGEVELEVAVLVELALPRGRAAGAAGAAGGSVLVLLPRNVLVLNAAPHRARAARTARVAAGAAPHRGTAAAGAAPHRARLDALLVERVPLQPTNLVRCHSSKIKRLLFVVVSCVLPMLSA